MILKMVMLAVFVINTIFTWYFTITFAGIVLQRWKTSFKYEPFKTTVIGCCATGSLIYQMCIIIFIFTFFPHMKPEDIELLLQLVDCRVCSSAVEHWTFNPQVLSSNLNILK